MIVFSLLLVLGLILFTAGLEVTIRWRAAADRGAWTTRPLPLPDPKATRIVVLGDSIAYAPNLTTVQAWPALLEEYLAAVHPSRTWQVINAGVSGNTVADGYARFERHVSRYKPHVVLITFGINDCRQVYRAIDARRIAQFERNEMKVWGRSYLLRALAARLRSLPDVDYAAEAIAKGPRIPPESFSLILAWLARRSQRAKIRAVLLTPTPVSSHLPAGRRTEFAHWAEYGTLIREVARSLDTAMIELSHTFPDVSPWAEDGVHLSAEGEKIVAERVWQALRHPRIATSLRLETQASNAEMAPSLE